MFDKIRNLPTNDKGNTTLIPPSKRKHLCESLIKADVAHQKINVTLFIQEKKQLCKYLIKTDGSQQKKNVTLP